MSTDKLFRSPAAPPAPTYRAVSPPVPPFGSGDDPLGWDDIEPAGALAVAGPRLVATARGLSLAVALLGIAVLIGYRAGIARLVEVAPSLPPMYPSVALAFVALGVGVHLGLDSSRRVRRAAVVPSAAVAGCGAVLLVLHATRAGLTSIETVWSVDFVVTSRSPGPGRPAVEAALALLVLGVASMLLALQRAPRLCQSLALGGVAVGTAAIVGFAVGVDRLELAATGPMVGMAMHTAVGVVLAGLAVFLGRPHVGVVSRLASAGPGGHLARRLVAVAVATPIALTAIAAALYRVFGDRLLVDSIVAVVQGVALAMLVLVPASGVDRLDALVHQTRREARARLEAVGEQDAVIAVIAAELLVEPPPPPGWRIAVGQEQAWGELAGDTLQLLPRDGERFLLALFDLAGHGSLAALNAFRFRTEIETLWDHGAALPQILDRLNRTAMELSTIATGVLIEIDAVTGTVAMVNAGHPAPLRVDGGAVEPWDRTGPLLGVPQDHHVPRIHQVKPGELLVVYTDGMSEARRPGGEPLGDDRLVELIGHWAHEEPSLVVAACLDAAHGHAAGRLPDDALVLVLQRL